MLISDILSMVELEDALDKGYVSERKHPEFPLSILNYTAQCQYEGAWNETTRQCRGLIFDHESGDVVARPWPKFFNYGEEAAGEFDLDAPALVYDKLDGSLGILYQYDGRYAIATRGSFTSEQALWATKFYRDRYGMPPVPGWTFLFEVIYPANRIVVDYGGKEMLVALGSVNIETGIASGPPTTWPGPRAEQLSAQTLRQALALTPRKNAEGVVVIFPESPMFPKPSRMVKLKQEDYVALHRIVTGTNPRTIHERLGSGEGVEEIVAGLPEEFAAWVRDIAAQLLTRYTSEYEATQRLFNKLDERLRAGIPPEYATHDQGDGKPYSRKEFAALATATDRPGWLFQLLDGKDIKPEVWKSVRPKGDDARAEES